MNEVHQPLKDVKKIGLFGLGLSNLGVMEYLRGKYSGTFVIRSDTVLKKEDIPGELASAPILVGKDAYLDIDEDVLFLSPSVRRDRPELSDACARGTVITSDIEAFLSMSKCPVFAVSGSDGKSTTCELAYRFLSTKNENTHKSGNCGKSSLPLLDTEGSGHLHVVEISSFMLEYMKPSVYRAVITNISENHLNWHGSFEAYIRAKENLTVNAKERALWCDDPICDAMADRVGAEILISAKHSSKKLAKRCDTAITLEGDRICLDGMPLLRTENIKRRELYNIKNLMSAVALCHGHFDSEGIQEVAASFGGIEHRCQSVGSFDGVEYIDSSIDSSPMRTRETLLGLEREVILILGGRGKGLSYEPLCDAVRKRCRAVVLTGENADEIKSALTDDIGIKDRIPIYEGGGFEDAVALAKSLTKICKTVLLSPASTSYNEFKNFEERGDFFQKIVSK